MTTPSARLAREVLGAVLARGCRDVVLSPGSRNAPLGFAAFDASTAGAVRLHTRVDERTAGFLGLGMARTSQRPVAVVCTSGTAAANLHPAVLEALHSGVPLVVVTADRPERLRGTSANQTTDQVGLFPHVPCADLSDGGVSADAAMRDWDGAGPLHLNVQFEEPLVPDDRWSSEAVGAFVDTASIGPKRHDFEPDLHRLGPNRIDPGPRTVVVAGDDAGPPARVLAERAGWPLLAEPSSGSRTGENALRCYRLLLDGPLGGRIERVVVGGHPTLSRPVTRLLARDEVEVWAAPTRGLVRERPFRVDHEASLTQVEVVRDDSGWLEEWRAADADVASRLDTLLDETGELTPYHVAGAVSRALPPGGLLHVGASNPIRDLDLMVAKYEVGRRRMVVANRGLAGIDGTLSSAIGGALGRPHSTRALALVGDVTFLHDLTGLVLGPREERPDLTVVVVNDDGGSIFAVLEQGDPTYADRYDTLFGTPHGADLGAVCTATGIPHRRVTTRADLAAALAESAGGIEVVEAVVRRDNRRELDSRIRALGLR